MIKVFYSKNCCKFVIEIKTGYMKKDEILAQMKKCVFANQYHYSCTKNCTQNKNNNNNYGERMNWCEDMRDYLNYFTKTERKIKLQKIKSL